MTTTAAQPVRKVQVPEQRGGALVCPRCSARLLHDGANVICVMCGYEYGVARLIAQRREAAGRPAPARR